MGLASQVFLVLAEALEELKLALVSMVSASQVFVVSAAVLEELKLVSLVFVVLEELILVLGMDLALAVRVLVGSMVVDVALETWELARVMGLAS